MKKAVLYSFVIFLLSASGFINAEESTTEKEAVRKSVKKMPERLHRKQKVLIRKDAASSMIWTKYSKELAEIEKLRRKDPEAFKTKSKEFFAKVQKEIKEEREKFKKLVAQYRETKDPETREKIKKYVSEAYDRRLKENAERIAERKKKLEEAEKKLEEAKAKKEERVNHRLKIILRDPKLNW